MEWNDMEWYGAEWNGMEQYGMVSQNQPICKAFQQHTHFAHLKNVQAFTKVPHVLVHPLQHGGQDEVHVNNSIYQVFGGT